MDIALFGEQKTGILVPISGTPDADYAFVPEPLPPRGWTWPSAMYPLLVEARTALASLDGTGRHLPNPQILLRPIQQREAQLSSQLEGTFTDPQQQALFQADPKYPSSVNDPTNAYREVFNYSKALKLRTEPQLALPLSLRLIRQLHGILMDGVRGADQRPGEFRITQNQINRPARYVPPPPNLLTESLSQFELYLHEDAQQFDPLIKAFLVHYQFEAIHPFGDGNGRVGRLLLAWTIADWCGLSDQWLYMSEFFERHKKAYMDSLLSISTGGAWAEWLSFCLQGVIYQSKITEARCERLMRLHRDFHKRTKVGSVRLSALIDKLFESPVLTVSMAQVICGSTYPTARSDLRKLADLGIIEQLANMAQITYYCFPIYSITSGREDVTLTNEPLPPPSQSRAASQDSET
jgi:Fic family protein